MPNLTNSNKLNVSFQRNFSPPPTSGMKAPCGNDFQTRLADRQVSGLQLSSLYDRNEGA